MYIKTIWAYSDLKRKTTHTCPRRNYLSVSSFKVLKYRDVFKPKIKWKARYNYHLSTKNKILKKKEEGRRQAGRKAHVESNDLKPNGRECRT